MPDGRDGELPVEIDPRIDERLKIIEKILVEELPVRVRRLEERIGPAERTAQTALESARSAQSSIREFFRHRRRSLTWPIVLRNAAFIAGLASIGVGTWQFSAPTALIVLGVIFVGLVILGSIKSGAKKEKDGE